MPGMMLRLAGGVGAVAFVACCGACDCFVDCKLLEEDEDDIWTPEGDGAA